MRTIKRREKGEQQEPHVRESNTQTIGFVTAHLHAAFYSVRSVFRIFLHFRFRHFFPLLFSVVPYLCDSSSRFICMHLAFLCLCFHNCCHFYVVGLLAELALRSSLAFTPTPGTIASYIVNNRLPTLRTILASHLSRTVLADRGNWSQFDMLVYLIA